MEDNKFTSDTERSTVVLCELVVCLLALCPVVLLVSMDK